MEIKEINRGIKFGIQVSGLDTAREYIANLCTSDISQVFTGQMNVLEDGLITFAWSAETTELMPNKEVMTLEIYTADRGLMCRKEKFAVVKNTSAATKS